MIAAPGATEAGDGAASVSTVIWLLLAVTLFCDKRS